MTSEGWQRPGLSAAIYNWLYNARGQENIRQREANAVLTGMLEVVQEEIRGLVEWRDAAEDC